MPTAPQNGKAARSSSSVKRDRSRRAATRKPWPLVGALVSIATLGAAFLLAVQLVWPDDLSNVPGGILWARYVLFMTATFAFHAGVAMVPIVLFSVLTRRLRLALLALVVCGLGAGPELLTLARRTPVAVPSGDTLGLMSINLMYGDAVKADVLTEIERRHPDVIVFQEWTDRAAKKLSSALKADYPYAIEWPRDDALGQAIFSRRVFGSDAKIFPPITGLRGDPQITVEVEHEGRALRITNVHVLPPVSTGHYREQRRAAAGLASWGAGGDAQAPHIFVGDFNGVSRSAVVKAFTSKGFVECHDESEGAGRWRATTWPRTGMLQHVPGIRLDHVLHASTLRCVEATVCGDVGSDHAPIFVRLQWVGP